jgi:hypothetical protein
MKLRNCEILLKPRGKDLSWYKILLLTAGCSNAYGFKNCLKLWTLEVAQ